MICMNSLPNPRYSLQVRAAMLVLWQVFFAVCGWNPVNAQQLNPVQANSNDSNELSLEQLVNIRVESVFGASKYEQKITEAPASISIITSDEIKKFGYRTLADALSNVRGLYVSYDRNYSYFGLRGFIRPGDYNTRELFP